MSRWCGSSSIIPGELWTDRDYGPWNSFQGRKKLKSSGDAAVTSSRADVTQNKLKYGRLPHGTQLYLYLQTPSALVGSECRESGSVSLAGWWRVVKGAFTVWRFRPFSLFACPRVDRSNISTLICAPVWSQASHSKAENDLIQYCSEAAAAVAVQGLR